jgi:signal transduction histidine kinase
MGKEMGMTDAGIGQFIRHPTPLIQPVAIWFRRNTFVPAELARRGVRPWVGYVVALALPLAAALADGTLIYFFPRLAFLGLLELLAVVLVALGWGAGPSLLATAVGGGLLSLALPAQLGPQAGIMGDILGDALFLAVGGALSVVAGRAERARRSAQAANRQMDELISVVSHELRQPLTSIQGGVQLMERRLAKLRVAEPALVGGPARPERPEREGPDDQIAAIQALVPGALREVALLNRLIDDLLDASRVKTHTLRVRMATCDLRAIARAAVEEQRLAWPARTITLVEDGELGADGGMPVLADADRIGQALRNYLTNALKYSAADRPVTLRLRRERGTARVEVRDAGPGLTPTQQRRVWERFHRAEGVRVRDGGGTSLGLGLHITREIVERHGGRVGVESAPGKGATFWLALPLADAT